jgi:hypothetical protein
MGSNRMNRMFALAMSVVVCASIDAAAQKPADVTKKLALRPIGKTAGTVDLQLLAQPQELTDADAFPLYDKAVKSLSKDLDGNKIRSWREMPVSQLPKDDVAAALGQLDANMLLLERAARCKRCDWPPSAEGDASIGVNACRNPALLLGLKARYQLAGGDYASCVRTLGTGLALARHLGAGPSVIDLLVGAAVSAIIYGEIESYVQQPGAPSLQAAIQAIPKPLFDEKHSDLFGMDAASRERAQLLLMRANRHAIALQYIETLRLYMTKAGKWPQTLDELKAGLPNDPVAGKPFSYKRVSDTQAILEGPLPKGGGAKDTVRYELTIAK